MPGAARGRRGTLPSPATARTPPPTATPASAATLTCPSMLTRARSLRRMHVLRTVPTPTDNELPRTRPVATPRQGGRISRNRRPRTPASMPPPQPFDPNQTLLTLIGRLPGLTSGTIEVACLDVSRTSSADFARVVAILRQDHFAARLTVRQLVGLRRFRTRAADSLRTTRRISRAVNFLDLTALAAVTSTKLSGVSVSAPTSHGAVPAHLLRAPRPTAEQPRHAARRGR